MSPRFWAIARLVVLCAAAGTVFAITRAPLIGQQTPPRPAATVPGELLIRVRGNASERRRQEIPRSVAASVLGRFDAVGVQHLRLPAGLSRTTAVNVLMSDPDVLAVQPNYIRHTDAPAPPNDPFWVNDSLWGLSRIQAPAVWSSFTTGSSSIVVADIDTGVNYAHPDLAANMWRNPGEVPGNGIDDDHNGYVDDIYGIDTFNHDSDPADDGGHGTHTAGIIAGVGNNGIGVVGVSWSARVLACKFMDAQGHGPDSGAIECFNYVTELRKRGINVAVTSNSWGSDPDPGESSPEVLKAAIDAAGAAGMLNVMAAGNDAKNTEVTPFYPGSFTSSTILTVAASDSDDQRAGFSNYGPISVDLAAPGVSILSTYASSYLTVSGTSMATPHVSGAAALLLAQQPGLSNDALKSVLMSSVDPLPQWSGLVASGGRLNVYKAALAVAGSATGGVTAAFASADSLTRGTWQGVYGSDGQVIVGDAVSLPSYAAIAASGQNTYVWAPSTSDVRALQRQSGDRVMAAWYGDAFSIDVTIRHTAPQPLSVYCADFDGFGRQQRFDVRDAATGALLDTRVLTGFGSGQWLTWNVLGHVRIDVTRLAGPNAVVSGMFLGGGAPPAGPGGTAAWVRQDTATQGNWSGAYGGDGYAIVGDATSLPGYVQLGTSGHASYTWASSTTDVRALNRASGAGRVMAAWYGTVFELDLNVTGTQARQLALYSADFDPWGRQQRFDMLDGVTGALLDSRTLGAFAGGEYAVWNVLGHVRIRVTSLSGPNAVVSGVFFGGPGASAGGGGAVFLKADQSTQGAWQGLYGARGYAIAGDGTSLPIDTTLTVTGASSYTWATATNDPRALQRAATGRVMAAWYGGTFNVDVSATGGPRQIAIYAADYDPWGRRQRVDVIDAATGSVLDTRTMSDFAGGQYLAWSIQGHVIIRLTVLSGPNAVLSGIFVE